MESTDTPAESREESTDRYFQEWLDELNVSPSIEAMVRSAMADDWFMAEHNSRHLELKRWIDPLHAESVTIWKSGTRFTGSVHQIITTDGRSRRLDETARWLETKADHS